MEKFDFLEYFQENIEKAQKSANGNWTGDCPSCGKGPAKFYCQLDPDHEKWGQFVCYSCDFKGRRFHYLVAMVDGITVDEAKRKVYQRDAVVFARRVETPESLRLRIESIRNPELLSAAALGEESAKTGTDLPAEFKSVYDASRDRWRVPEYLTERGFKRNTLREWNVGYCETGRFEGRAIIPMVCPNGKSFTGRDMTGTGFPKYLNPTGVDHSLLLFGWHTMKMGADFAIAEGPLDAMKLHQHGIPAVAFGGKSLSEAQLKLLFLHPESTSITLMLDGDALSNAFLIANVLKIKFKDVSIANIPKVDKHGNKPDPGSSTKKQAWRWYEEAKTVKNSNVSRVLINISESLEKVKKRLG